MKRLVNGGEEERREWNEWGEWRGPGIGEAGTRHPSPDTHIALNRTFDYNKLESNAPPEWGDPSN